MKLQHHPNFEITLCVTLITVWFYYNSKTRNMKLGLQFFGWGSEPKLNRTQVNESRKDHKCVGNAVAFYNQWKHHPSYDCNETRTRLTVLNRKSTVSDVDVEEEVLVDICVRHLRDAEWHHAWQMEKQPERWQHFVFPMSTPTKRSYFHNQEPIDWRRSMEHYEPPKFA